MKYTGHIHDAYRVEGRRFDVVHFRPYVLSSLVGHLPKSLDNQLFALIVN